MKFICSLDWIAESKKAIYIYQILTNFGFSNVYVVRLTIEIYYDL